MEPVKRANAKTVTRGSLWKLVQCVTLFLTSCNDARLLKEEKKTKQKKTSRQNLLEYLTEYFGWDREGWGTNRKTTLTKHGIEKA